jgi:hypothetical protein
MDPLKAPFRSRQSQDDHERVHRPVKHQHLGKDATTLVLNPFTPRLTSDRERGRALGYPIRCFAEIAAPLLRK